MKLSDAEEERITAEEVFRSEVRRKLESDGTAKSEGSRFWRLLNSSFTLWVLSSVVLAGLGKCYSQWEADQRELAARAELVRTIDLEVGNRIEQARLGLRTNKVRIGTGRVYRPIDIYAEVTDYLNNKFAGDTSSFYDVSTYPQFRTRSFRSLISELAQGVPDAERKRLEQVLTTFETLADSGSLADTSTAGGPAATITAIENAGRLIEEHVLLERWRTGWSSVQQ
ncbi:MAG TPA: hypothetical protein VFT45_27635 [Longimicrobium sp.]|nr:hypothetical protein [Longimicrobium sp.]